MMRDDLTAVNKELTEEIEQLKAELRAAHAEREQALLDLQTLRSVAPHPATALSLEKCIPVPVHYTRVLRSQNYLFPATSLSIISAPAPATATYCHLKLFYNSSTILTEVEISFSSS